MDVPCIGIERLQGRDIVSVHGDDQIEIGKIMLADAPRALS